MITCITNWTLCTNITTKNIARIFELTIGTKIIRCNWKWTCTFFTILRCSFCGITIVTYCTSITSWTNCIVFTFLNNKRSFKKLQNFIQLYYYFKNIFFFKYCRLVFLVLTSQNLHLPFVIIVVNYRTLL